MKTGQTHPEGKTGKWCSKWLETLFMDGDAIRSSWDFPLLEALIFHVECLVRSNWLLCCVWEAALVFGALAGHFRGTRWRERERYPSKGHQQMCVISWGTEADGSPPLSSLLLMGHTSTHMIFYCLHILIGGLSFVCLLPSPVFFCLPRQTSYAQRR